MLATENTNTWLVLAGVVAATLAFKGYVKLPAWLRSLPSRASSPVAGSAASPPASGSNMTSHELGVLFAQAKKREAELELADLFAKQAGDALKASFTAPFSPPAPAGQDQAPPAGPPA